MRVDSREYEQLELRAHSLLAGVPIHDVWAVDLPGDGAGRSLLELREDLAREGVASSNLAVRLLFALRARIGRALGWDVAPSREADVGYLGRLSEADRQASRVTPGTREGPFRVLYASRREAISEIRNATVHAFTVFALVERPTGHRLYWAVYVEPVGRITSWYIRLIDPFRRHVIYPAVLRRIHSVWTREPPGSGGARA